MFRSNYYLHKIQSTLKFVIFSTRCENVPALGESITEGSIASWSKNEGDQVAIDDVIVIVETDKVTVDIKSTHAGILIKKIALDTVVVGNPLYEIDVNNNESKFSIESSTIKQTNSPIHTDNNDTNPKAHIPLIKFTGKRDHSKKYALNIKDNMIKTQETKHNVSPIQTIKSIKTSITNNKIIKESNGILFTTLKEKGFYGRPKFTLKEIEAIESGGATL